MLFECRVVRQVIVQLCALNVCVLITCVIGVISLPQLEIEFLG